MGFNQRGVIVPLVLFGTAALLSGIGLLFYFLYFPKQQINAPKRIITPSILPASTDKPTELIRNFETCAAAGNPIAESYPRTCRFEGKIYTEIIVASSSAVPSPIIQTAICQIGGCNGEICGGVDDKFMSTCIARPEYSCYANATCEVQADGLCGWTQSAELVQCIKEKQVE